MRRWALLRMAARIGVRCATGLLATEEEVAVVRRLGLPVQQGLTDRLPVSDQSSSVIVCNNVLLIVPKERVPASLHEIYRGREARCTSFFWEKSRSSRGRLPRFETAREALAYLYREHGLRTWLGLLRRMAYWKLTGQPMVIRRGMSISLLRRALRILGAGRGCGSPACALLAT